MTRLKQRAGQPFTCGPMAAIMNETLCLRGDKSPRKKNRVTRTLERWSEKSGGGGAREGLEGGVAIMSDGFELDGWQLRRIPVVGSCEKYQEKLGGSRLQDGRC
ncbi:hypothetical protein EYF80_041305 [Liparis tanakae]|uniref:Uncharacterized protein n=1 Tax=Liparis tanakae TaxID=230148 RepID=A0A4Z2G6R2_9TELE|nr:hypothetical protein EYF80_041305 [Liparis tanakae]